MAVVRARILIMMGLFGTSMTGSNLLYEMQTDSHERMTVAPLTDRRC